MTAGGRAGRPPAGRRARAAGSPARARGCRSSWSRRTTRSPPRSRVEAPRGASLARAARRLGIATVRDLLFHLPRRYDDLPQL